MYRGRGIGWGGVIYLVLGAIVADRHHYFAHLNTWRELLSAVLAVMLWPLILLGISLQVRR